MTPWFDLKSGGESQRNGVLKARHPVARPLALVLAAAAASVWAAEGGAPHAVGAATSPSGFWAYIIDNLFAISILLIFLGAVVGAVINARRRDRVLKDFDRYHVTAVLQDGRRIWGVMGLSPNGMELRYRRPYRNPDGNIHNSFILYQNEYSAVRALLRLETDLTPENRERRFNELLRYYNPTALRRIWRWTCKQFSILRDAFIRSLTLLIGQAKKAVPTSTMTGAILSTQDKQITEIGATVISSVNLMNDPILERHIGRWCVAEIKEGAQWREIPGILKEYSSDWIELLEASWPREISITLEAGQSGVESAEAHCTLRREGDILVIENHPPEALELVEYIVEGEARLLANRLAPPGESTRIETGDASRSAIQVRLRVKETADVILPRSMALVRHAGRREQISWLQAIGLGRKSAFARHPRRANAKEQEN